MKGTLTITGVDLLRELNSDSRILPTDYFRVVITLAAMGQDPTDFEGINILERMYNYQGLNNYTSQHDELYPYGI